MSHLELFAKYRAYLYALACRTLGSAVDTEDLLQETFLRWQQTALGTIRLKQHLTSESSRFTASPEELEILTRQFTQTSTNGDLESLISLLAYA